MSTPFPHSFWSYSRAKQRVLAALCALALSSLAGACSDENEKSGREDSDAGVDAGPPPTASKASLRPALERPPTNGLPADLRPPR